jgi:hypothetical protein
VYLTTWGGLIGTLDAAAVGDSGASTKVAVVILLSEDFKN